MSASELKQFEDVYQLMSRVYNSLVVVSNAMPTPALSQVVEMQNAAVERMTQALAVCRAGDALEEWPEVIPGE